MSSFVMAFTSVFAGNRVQTRSIILSRNPFLFNFPGPEHGIVIRTVRHQEKQSSIVSARAGPGRAFAETEGIRYPGR